MALEWRGLYAKRFRTDQESPLRDLLRFSSMPGLISLAGGFPAAELFPVDELHEAFDAVMSSEPSSALQYGTAEGYLPLRGFLAERLSRFGVRATPEELLIVNGSQQGLDLLARLFVDPGSTVVVEDPSYVGGLQAFAACEARYLIVPADDEGMQVERLEELLKGTATMPRLIYVLPNFQNPCGATLSLARRRALLELSHRHGIPIVEDDPYGELRFEGEPLPSLKSMDEEGTVIQLGTFSKILVPGLRLGWVVAEREVIQKLVNGKQSADLNSSALAQRVAWEACRRGALERQIERVKPVYRERRDVMLKAVAKQLPAGSCWSRPEGGLFLWATLPDGVDTGAMLAEAVTEKVAYVPGSAFDPLGRATSNMRLNFSSAAPDQIEEGIARIGTVARRRSEQTAGEGRPTLPIDLASAA
jgi:2-aminoadipate transaminase